MLCYIGVYWFYFFFWIRLNLIYSFLSLTFRYLLSFCNLFNILGDFLGFAFIINFVIGWFLFDILRSKINFLDIIETYNLNVLNWYGLRRLNWFNLILNMMIRLFFDKPSIILLRLLLILWLDDRFYLRNLLLLINFWYVVCG